MILTGSKISEEIETGRIVLEPFSPDQVNPNSYNYRLGPKLKVFTGMRGDEPQFRELTLPEEGFILQPKTMYLGHTFERIGSSVYAMSLIGRSSLGRYGLFLQISANLGHTTSSHCWTLELHALRPIRVYPGMVIGQVSFWMNQGIIHPFGATYANFSEPHEPVRRPAIQEIHLPERKAV
jgi:dCTP deaminase